LQLEQAGNPKEYGELSYAKYILEIRRQNIWEQRRAANNTFE